MTTKRFLLRDLLTVTTGRLLTKPNGPNDNGIDALYVLLNWLTSDNLSTHQLPRASRECRPWLLRWFPELSQARCEDLDLAMSVPGVSPSDSIERWVLDLQTIAGLKAEYDVPKIPADDHERKDAFDELVQMRGTDGGIVIV